MHNLQSPGADLGFQKEDATTTRGIRQLYRVCKAHLACRASKGSGGIYVPPQVEFVKVLTEEWCQIVKVTL